MVSPPALDALVTPTAHGIASRVLARTAAGNITLFAFDAGEEHAPRWQDAHTIASGIRVPQAIGDFLILRAVRAKRQAAAGG